MQCGYCTPGMVIAAYDLLRENPDPTDAEIRHALHGNICRCTGYQHIVKAIQHAAETLRAQDAAVGSSAMIPERFAYTAPTTIAESLALLAEHGDDARCSRAATASSR